MSVFKEVVFLLALLTCLNLSAQVGERVALYENDSEDSPALYLNLHKSTEAKPTVLILPGGGYQMLAMDHEGSVVAKWFQERGVNAVILKYSLGNFTGNAQKHPAMINDAKRAMRLLRANAEKWNINPDMIAVLGFSAGGHLASTLATHSDSGDSNAEDPIEQFTCVPNLCVLFYPVIMMDGPQTHWGSRRFLLGPTPNRDDIVYLSNEKHVNVSTPPTILFHTSDDASVPVQNSISYYIALRKMGIPAEMHISEHGAHGVGLVVDDYSLGQWESLLENWLTRWKWIHKN